MYEEAHQATLRNERTAATFAPLVQPGEKLGIILTLILILLDLKNLI